MIVSWRKAITMLFKGKVEVIASYEREIRSVTLRIKHPSVLRLLRHVRIKRPYSDVPFTRGNVYARDGYSCQYCETRLPPARLTFDHVIPVRRPEREAAPRAGTTSSPAASPVTGSRETALPRRSVCAWSSGHVDRRLFPR